MNQQKIDRFGSAASLGCAIHCACMPLVLAILPAIGVSFFASEPMEWMLFGVSASLGCISMALGYRKHGNKSTVFVMLCGLILLLEGRLLHETLHLFGVMLLVVGGCTIAMAHLMNHHRCRCVYVKPLHRMDGQE